MKIVNVEISAKDAGQGAKRDDVVVVVDVLRCTSSIITALANGATDITAVRSVSGARKLKLRNPESVLAGERGGIPPKGFELGNSPLEFSAKNVKGKSVIITTSSGTLAINNASKAKFVLLGAFLNVTSVAKKAWKIADETNSGITVVLSGKLGSFALEDFLCAGAIMNVCGNNLPKFSDSAYGSLLAYKIAKDSLLQHVLKGTHAQELVELGLKDDVVLCCDRDRYGLIPILKEGKIVRLETI